MAWRKQSSTKDSYALPTPTTPPGSPFQRRKLRILGTGTLFVTHLLTVPATHSYHVGFSNQDDDQDDDTRFAPTTLRAQNVTRSRGGSAARVLSILCQFGHIDALRSDSQSYLKPVSRESDIEAWLVAPVGRGSEAAALLSELEKEGVRTKLCARREGEGVPCAYVVKTSVQVPIQGEANGNTNGQPRMQTRVKRTVINYNPIPDLTHDEFVRLLGPLLYPPVSHSNSQGSSSPTNRTPTTPEGRFSTDEGVYFLSPDPPVDWLHFEGRTAQTTLSNLTGLDGFARDRGWRNKMVFSLDCCRVGRQGQEAVSQGRRISTHI